MNYRVKDLTGQTFPNSLLTVISYAGVDKQRQSLWHCRCECGNEVVVRTGNLKNGNTKSCGCLRVKKMTKHGCVGTYLYQCWQAMKKRSTNPNNKDYAHYGRRGITVCERWDNSFEDFRDDILEKIGERPSPQHSLDRINNDGNYEPGNVRWATQKQQTRKRRSNRLFLFQRKMCCIGEIAELTGMPYNALYYRLITRRWSVEKTLTTPIRKGRHEN
jgi:hypothetical protein